MMVRVVSVVLSLVALFSSVTAANAQDRIAPGYLDFGFSVADAQMDDANVSFGLRAEKLLGTMGKGVVGLQLGVSASSYPFGLGHKWVFVPVGLAATYHFRPGSGRLDPFVAVGGGYKFANCVAYPYIYADCSAEDDEFFGIARLGAKYFTSDRVGFVLDAGLGASYVSAGLVIKVN